VSEHDPASGDPSPLPPASESRSAALRRSAETARAAAERRVERAKERRAIREAIESFQSEQRTGATLLAGGLAYRFFLWLVPFGLTVAAIVSFWVRDSQRTLTDAAKSFGLGGVAVRSATSAVEEGSNARWYLLIAGVALMIWAGISAVRALRVAARLAWAVGPERLRRPVRSSAVFTIICILGLAASMAASWVRHHSPAWGVLITIADVFIYAPLALFAFARLPRAADAPWQADLPGALLVGVGMTGVHLFLAYYLAGKLERSPSLYGTLGAATVVMLVLFLIARLIVSALFLNATLQRSRVDA
jgi:uncharacterized BrkB/YihY/UPF0761 family membrane protein